MAYRQGNESLSKTRISVKSEHVVETESEILAKYEYKTTRVMFSETENAIKLQPIAQHVTFKTIKTLPKLGLMMVGWGGNNGSTLTAGIIANRDGIVWESQRGIQKPNYYGSLMMSSTIRIGYDQNNQEVFVPLKDVLPVADPNQLVLGGWDISKVNLADAMDRAQVLEPDLKNKLRPMMKKMVPLPSIYYPDFIAANQKDRADNLISGSKSHQLHVIRQNIADFKALNNLDKVIVIWTANTERFIDIVSGVNDTSLALQNAIEQGHEEISPSQIFAVAAIKEGCPFINGSPQNTFVPGLIELASELGVYIGGDDFKSGQTKIKSVLVDYLIASGIKPLAITSYNHLGNNDGKNLSAPQQFRSKEISKSNVVDDMVSSNRLLYAKNEKPDHVVVIKYVPSVGDSKRALDEYESEIFMGGRNTISLHNTCEDSLLASPLIVDLVLLTELMTRISMRVENTSAKNEPCVLPDTSDQFKKFNSVLSFLSYMLKAPLVPNGAPIVNALFRQRNAIENLFRACIGLSPDSELMLENRI